MAIGVFITFPVVKNHLLIWASILTGFSALAQDYQLTGGLAGMGHTGVSQSSLWSVVYNPAGMGEVAGLQAGVFADARFASADLTIGGFGLVAPVQEGRVGLSYARYGSSVFSEQMLGLGYGRKLGDKVSAGIKLNLHTLQVGNGYGGATAVSGDVGVLFQPTNALSIGASLHNPTRAQFTEIGDERLPVLLKGGATYAFSDAVRISAEVWKELNEDPQVKSGLAYRVHSNFEIMAGVGTGPSLFSFGAGYSAGDFRLDVAASYHSTLGFSPQMALIYARSE